jgi:hypothetical protein
LLILPLLPRWRLSTHLHTCSGRRFLLRLLHARRLWQRLLSFSHVWRRRRDSGQVLRAHARQQGGAALPKDAAGQQAQQVTWRLCIKGVGGITRRKKE